MQKAIRIIFAEHRSLSAILSALSSLAHMARDPALRPDFAVLHAMVYYIDTFPERLHHPKEEEHLFARLAKRDPEAGGIIAALREEHVKGAAMVRDLERALNEFESIWPRGADQFAAAVSAYSQFHWNHMRREEHDLIPRAEKCFTAEDWDALETAFAANNEPIGDLDHNDFKALFQRILRLAPAPVGLGDRWTRQPGAKAARAL